MGRTQDKIGLPEVRVFVRGRYVGRRCVVIGLNWLFAWAKLVRADPYTRLAWWWL